MLDHEAVPESDKWLLWRDGAHSPAFNMAADEAMLLTAKERGLPVLRVYAWDRPAVSIGYVQRLSAAPQEGFTIVRRPTGGGVVYHDHDFTYTVVAPAGHWLVDVDRMQSYGHVNRAVALGLQYESIPAELSSLEIPHTVDRASMVCFTNPTRYDVMAGDRKIAGSAQRRTRDGILHQGSIHFGESDPLTREQLTELLLRGFREHLHAELIPFEPEPEFIAFVDKMVRDRYDTDEWNARR